VGNSSYYGSGVMHQPHLGDVTIYADITEVWMETRAAEYKKLLADGWVLLGGLSADNGW
jgi:hypothetical protein